MHYDPTEPRIPKGTKGGGRWTLRDITTAKKSKISKQLHKEFTAQSRPLDPADFGFENFDTEYQKLEGWFPEINTLKVDIVCPPTHNFNCVGLALNDTDRWWWPGGAFWPDGVRDDETVEAFDDLLINHCHGEVIDKDWQVYQPGYVNLALFVDNTDEPQHLARLLPNGKWISKLGGNFGFTHELSEAETGIYGQVKKVYKLTEEEFAKIREME